MVLCDKYAEDCSGIYTAPSVEAMVFDLQVLKRVGINTVRKHIKVEPALYYKACDGMYSHNKRCIALVCSIFPLVQRVLG